MREVAHRVATALIDHALPPRCPACAAVTGDMHRFCADCWVRLDFLGPPGDDDDAGVRAAVAYGDVARAVLLKLKYARRLGHAEPAAAAMRRLVPDDAELLVPVPLAWRRLWSRGYNQAGLIASALSRRSAVPVAHDVLVRTRATPVLKGLGPAARRRAVAGAFAVRRAESLADRHVVLVDDVFTTGATAYGCAAVLAAAGAARVSILTFARVMPGDAD
ncbi:ComF family protein [Sphingomonas sp.]|uniref:ComF family protein n=1 Tax=Sphingomonas sp. TaxID=28214 RepID=UPI002C25F087|nr:double zinc ribbon domain-containing protein [Sphingomonas sp.]HTG39124.1 double zinc ribbon domain-containing protein [Sphingomonas sp.]